jgi:hypothetical protein
MSAPDLDELLKLLEDQVEEKKAEVEKFNQDSCERFISKMNVRQGLEKVPNYVIYYTYRKKYKASLGEERISKIHFFRLFNKLFNQTRVGKQRYYLLDGPFDLSREGLLEAKKFDKEYTIEIKKARGTYKAPKRRRRKKKESEK